jgi:hypothetical protein
MEIEEWRDIPGYPGYKASSLGRIQGSTGRILKIHPNCQDGYLQITLSYGRSEKYSVTIHKLIALAFLPPKPHPKWQIDHIDQNKLNNNVDNLRWVCQEDNQVNRGARKDCISGVKGLSWHSIHNSWRCVITRYGKTHERHFKERSDAEKWLADKRSELGI